MGSSKPLLGPANLHKPRLGSPSPCLSFPSPHHPRLERQRGGGKAVPVLGAAGPAAAGRMAWEVGGPSLATRVVAAGPGLL